MFKKKPEKEKKEKEIKTNVEEEFKDTEKIEPAKKKEKPSKTPKAEEQTASAVDIINDLYNQLEVVGKTLVNMEKEINALKMNQVWLQQYITNALKATEVSK